MNYHRIIRAVESEVWAIEEHKLDAICELLRLKVQGKDIEFIKAPLAPEPYVLVGDIEVPLQTYAATDPSKRPGGSIAVLPIFGMISNRANMMTNYSGGTSLQTFSKQFRQVLNDPDVSAIV